MLGRTKDSYSSLRFLFLLHKMALDETGEVAQLVKRGLCKREHLKSGIQQPLKCLSAQCQRDGDPRIYVGLSDPLVSITEGAPKVCLSRLETLPLRRQKMLLRNDARGCGHWRRPRASEVLNDVGSAMSSTPVPQPQKSGKPPGGD